jgi:geranylgeranyl diphosphate synthase type II
MISREEISGLADDYIGSLGFPSQPEGLYGPIRYALGSGGKRLRPALVLMAYNVFASDVERALPAAAALEMFHTFTLLHDDIMDNAAVRRGAPSVHSKWGANTAILSGDAMMIAAYKLLEGVPHLPEVFSEFNKLALEVCEGQQMDMDFERRGDVALEEYMEMIRLKTAALIAGAAKIGAIAAGAPVKDAEAIYKYGIELGLAFQLQDDYLDTYGTPETLGKNIGGDIAEGKKTFLAITAMEAAGEATRRAILATFADTSHPLRQKVERIRTIYNSLDVPEITLAAVERHLGAAAAALDSLGREAPALREMITTLRDRNH